MKNILVIIAGLLIVIWGIIIFFFDSSMMTHLLLVKAGIILFLKFFFIRNRHLINLNSYVDKKMKNMRVVCIKSIKKCVILNSNYIYH